MRIAVNYLFLLALATSLISQNPFISINEAKIAKKLDQFAKNYRITSISFSMFKGSQYSFSHATGLADMTKKIKATPEHIYPIASLTKPITASLVNELLRSDSLRLSDPARLYVDSFPSDITIQQLMTHMTGLQRNKEYGRLEESHYSDIVSFLPRWRKKRGKFNYTNINYSALASVLETTHDTNYTALVTDYFQNELDSAEITFVNEDRSHIISPIVRNYVKKGWRRYPHKSYNVGLWQPAALAMTSSQSLSKFLRKQMNQENISHIGSASAFVKYRWYSGAKKIEERYGLGFRLIYDNDELKYVYHNGFMYGTVATMYYIPKYDIGFVALSNMSGYPRQSFSFSSIILSIVKQSLEAIELDTFEENFEGESKYSEPSK